MAPQHSGKVPLWWGTKNQDTVWGLCNNISEKPEKEKEEIRSGDNEIVGLTFSAAKRGFTLDYTPIEAAAGADMPTMAQDLIGGVIQVTPLGAAAPVDCIIEEAEKKAERGKVSTFSITAYHYPSLELTAGGD